MTYMVVFRVARIDLEIFYEILMLKRYCASCCSIHWLSKTNPGVGATSNRHYWLSAFVCPTNCFLFSWVYFEIEFSLRISPTILISISTTSLSSSRVRKSPCACPYCSHINIFPSKLMRGYGSNTTSRFLNPTYHGKSIINNFFLISSLGKICPSAERLIIPVFQDTVVFSFVL